MHIFPILIQTVILFCYCWTVNKSNIVSNIKRSRTSDIIGCSIVKPVFIYRTKVLYWSPACASVKKPMPRWTFRVKSCVHRIQITKSIIELWNISVSFKQSVMFIDGSCPEPANRCRRVISRWFWHNFWEVTSRPISTSDWWIWNCRFPAHIAPAS